MNNSTLKIAAYTRISVDDELEGDNVSIENQKEVITEYVSQRFPDSQVDFYEDRDKSGYTFEQRPGYQRMRSKLFGGNYDLMIVKDFSRFSRRNSHGLVELEQLRDAGVRIISISDNVDYPSRDDWMVIQLRFLMNEMPVTETSKKVKTIVDIRQKKGEWICNVPFGYYLHPTKKNTVCVDPDGAKIVKLIFDLYNSGYGYKKIAKYLTEHKYPTARAFIKKHIEEKDRDSSGIRVGDIWSAVSVAEIIKNDFYTGTLRQHKSSRPGINKKPKKLDPTENIVFANHHEAIIDKKTFEKATERNKHNTHTHYKGVRKYSNPYVGRFYCGDCGSPMFSTSNPKRPDGYVCGNYHRRGLSSGCTSHHIHRSSIDNNVKAFIKTVENELKDKVSDYNAGNNKERILLNKQEISKLQAQVESDKAALLNLTRQKLQDITKNPNNERLIQETYDSLEKEYIDGITLAEAKIAYLEEDSEKKREIKKNIEHVLETFGKLMDKKEFTAEDIALIIERITIDKDKVVTINLKSSIDELKTIIGGK